MDIWPGMYCPHCVISKHGKSKYISYFSYIFCYTMYYYMNASTQFFSAVNIHHWAGMHMYCFTHWINPNFIWIKWRRVTVHTVTQLTTWNIWHHVSSSQDRTSLALGNWVKAEIFMVQTLSHMVTVTHTLGQKWEKAACCMHWVVRQQNFLVYHKSTDSQVIFMSPYSYMSNLAHDCLNDLDENTHPTLVTVS